jgi:hypothetical protein
MGKKQGTAGEGGASGKGFSAPGQQRPPGASGGSQTPEDTVPEGLDKDLSDLLREGLQKYMASFNNK